MRKRIAALVLMSAAAPALAGDSRGQWLEVKSAHFDVLTDSSAAQARHIASQLEQIRAVFEAILPARDQDDAPIVVLAFKDRKGLQSVEPTANLARGQLEHAGYFLPAEDRNYILLRLDAEQERPFAPVYHEYTHYTLRKNIWLPLWLNEGLAEFYQNTEIHATEVQLGAPSRENLQILRQTRLLPLDTLFRVDYASPYYHEEQKGTIFYAESWALTHMLMTADVANGTHRIDDYFARMSKGEDPVAAAQAVFGDLSKLQHGLEAYIDADAMRTFTRRATVTADESRLHAGPLAPFAADTVLADVDIVNGRYADAGRLLATVLETQPPSAIALETMGSLKFHEGKIEEARVWFGKAVALGSSSYLAQYYFAAMSLQSHKAGANDTNAHDTNAHDANAHDANAQAASADDAIETGLHRAIELNPAFAPPYDTLSSFYALRREKLEQARQLSQQAVQLEPENLGYRLNASQVLLDLEQPAEARKMLGQALKVARTPAQIALVHERIADCDVFQAKLTRQKHAESQANVNALGRSIAVMNGAQRGDPPEPKAPSYPTEEPTGKHHRISGIIANVHCYSPSMITLDVEQDGGNVSLYRNNYFRIAFTAGNVKPTDEINPCTALEGIKAIIDYAEVSDKRIAGQIVAIDLTQ